MENAIGILHSSDLHIGREPANDQFTRVPVLRHGNGHSLLLARGLREAVNDVIAQWNLAEDDELYHVMSGDLTATGDGKEFLVGHSFLRSLWREKRSPHSSLIGFNLNEPDSHPGPRLVTVPGNHDQWKGQGFLKNVGYNPRLRRIHFRETFWIRQWRSGELEVEVYGLDSNAGLPQSRGPWRQRGELDLKKGGEVDRLEQHLANNPFNAMPPEISHRVRVLVIHHSFASGGGLKRRSRDSVLRLAESHRFAAVLTGHAHDFLNNPMDTQPGKLRTIIELRTASAMQGPETRLRPSPGFLAHRILVDGNRVRWQSWRYEWNATVQGFAVLSSDLSTPFADFFCP